MFLLSCDCQCSVSLPCSDMGWYVIVAFPGLWKWVTLFNPISTHASIKAHLVVAIGFCLFVWFDSLHTSQQFFSNVGTGLLGWTSTKQGLNVSLSRTQHSADGEARTSNPSTSGQALYHWATALTSHWIDWKSVVKYSMSTHHDAVKYSSSIHHHVVKSSSYSKVLSEYSS